MQVESIERRWASDRLNAELRDLTRRVRLLEHLEEQRRSAEQREESNRVMRNFTILMWLASVVVYSIIFAAAFAAWR